MGVLALLVTLWLYSIAHGSFPCNFDSDFCAWTQDSTDDFDWRRQKTGTLLSYGPSADHTSGDGYYAHAKESYDHTPYTTARLLSPLMGGSAKCLTFWYMMSDVSYYDAAGVQGDLNVYTRSGSSQPLGTPVLTRSGSSTQWVKVNLDISSTDPFQVVVEAKRGLFGYQGYISIDDISFSDGVCTAGVGCEAGSSLDADALPARLELYLAFVGLHSNLYAADAGDHRNATLFITNPGDTPVQVEVSYMGVPSASSRTLCLAGGASEEVTLSTAVILSGAAKHEACAVVTSDSPVLVQASLEYSDGFSFSMAGYQALPFRSMKGDYIVATHCVIKQCVFVVTSAEDGNAVEVHIRTDGTGSAQYNGTHYSDGQGFDEMLNKGESLQVTCDTCDLTGTLVSASGKVTVVGGGDFTRFQYDNNHTLKDAVADVMLPVEYLGQQYVLGSGHADLYEIVKVVVLEAGDSFTYDGVQQAAATRDRQVYVMPTRAMSHVVRLESHNGRLLVMEVMAGLADMTFRYPDVSMTLALPVAQWTSVYGVYLPSDQESLTLSLVSDIESASFNTSIAASSESSWSVNGFTTTSMDFSAAGGSLLTIRSFTGCNFSGFLIHDKELRSSVIPLLPLQLEPVNITEGTTTEVATTTVNIITTEEGTTTEEATTTTTTQVIATEEATTIEEETTRTTVSTTEETTPTEETTARETVTATKEATTTVQETTTETLAETEEATPTEEPAMTEAATTTDTASSTQESTTTEATTTNIPTEAATPISTPQPGAQAMGYGRCVCLVYDINDTSTQEIMAEADSELLMDRKSLSSYMRSKTSAPNRKPSSVYMGTALGAAIFGTAFAVIVLPDLLSLLRHVVRRACMARSQEAQGALSSEASEEGAPA